MAEPSKREAGEGVQPPSSAERSQVWEGGWRRLQRVGEEGAGPPCRTLRSPLQVPGAELSREEKLQLRKEKKQQKKKQRRQEEQPHQQQEGAPLVQPAPSSAPPPPSGCQCGSARGVSAALNWAGGQMDISLPAAALLAAGSSPTAGGKGVPCPRWSRPAGP